MKSAPLPPRLPFAELNRRVEPVLGYAYKLFDTGQPQQPGQAALASYGLDVVLNDGPLRADPNRMSLWMPFVDGNTRDGVGDLLEIGGIDTSRHRINPIVLFDHGKHVQLPIAQASDPEEEGSYTVVLDPVRQCGELEAFFYQGSKDLGGLSRDENYQHALFCEQLYDLVIKKFLRGGSIGYQVVRAKEIPPNYERGTPKGLHLIQTKMLEGSLVVLPANMVTVRKSLSADGWNPVEAAREILALPNVCGKSLSPYLVKSLTPLTKASPRFVETPPERYPASLDDPPYSTEKIGSAHFAVQGGHAVSGKPHRTRAGAQNSAIRHGLRDSLSDEQKRRRGKELTPPPPRPARPQQKTEIKKPPMLADAQAEIQKRAQMKKLRKTRRGGHGSRNVVHEHRAIEGEGKALVKGQKNVGSETPSKESAAKVQAATAARKQNRAQKTGIASTRTPGHTPEEYNALAQAQRRPVSKAAPRPKNPFSKQRGHVMLTSGEKIPVHDDEELDHGKDNKVSIRKTGGGHIVWGPDHVQDWSLKNLTEHEAKNLPTFDYDPYVEKEDGEYYVFDRYGNKINGPYDTKPKADAACQLAGRAGVGAKGEKSLVDQAKALFDANAKKLKTLIDGQKMAPLVAAAIPAVAGAVGNAVGGMIGGDDKSHQETPKPLAETQTNKPPKGYGVPPRKKEEGKALIDSKAGVHERLYPKRPAAKFPVMPEALAHEAPKRRAQKTRLGETSRRKKESHEAAQALGYKAMKKKTNTQEQAEVSLDLNTPESAHTPKPVKDPKANKQRQAEIAHQLNTPEAKALQRKGKALPPPDAAPDDLGEEPIDDPMFDEADAGPMDDAPLDDGGMGMEGPPEKPGAILLRGLHDNLTILLAEYDSQLESQENPQLMAFMQGFMETLETTLTQVEEMFAMEYPEAEDLGGSAMGEEGFDDEMGMADEGLGDEEEFVEEGGMEEMPMEGGGEEFVGEEAGNADMDTMEDEGIGADSEMLPEPSPEEVLEGMEKDMLQRGKSLRGKYKAMPECARCGQKECKGHGKAMGTRKASSSGTGFHKDMTDDEADGTDNATEIGTEMKSYSKALTKDHKKSVREGADWLGEVGRTSSELWNDESRMKSYHYHKTLEGLIGLEEAEDLLKKNNEEGQIPAADFEPGVGAKAAPIPRPPSSSGGDGVRWVGGEHHFGQTVAGGGSEPEAGSTSPWSPLKPNEGPGREGGFVGKPYKIPGGWRQALHPDFDKSLHPHRKSCAEASGWLEELSKTRGEFGDKHRKRSEELFKSLDEIANSPDEEEMDEVAAGEVDQPEEEFVEEFEEAGDEAGDDEEATGEVGEVGEKAVDERKPYFGGAAFTNKPRRAVEEKPGIPRRNVARGQQQVASQNELTGKGPGSRPMRIPQQPTTHVPKKDMVPEGTKALEEARKQFEANFQNLQGLMKTVHTFEQK